MYWQLIFLGDMLKMEVDKLTTDEFYEAYAALEELNKEMKPKKKGGL